MEDNNDQLANLGFSKSYMRSWRALEKKELRASTNGTTNPVPLAIRNMEAENFD
jgi:hypothetical protein